MNDGLGFIRGSACPHYDGESERRSSYHQMITRGGSGGYAADDGVALHFVGRRLKQAVSSRPDARAYRVALLRGQVNEKPLPVRYLGRTAKR